MRVFAGVFLAALVPAMAAAQTPRPFPTPTGQTGRPTPPPQPSPSPAKPPAPGPATGSPASTPAPASTPDLGGIPVYPNAVYLTSYDAGRGQRFHLFGVMLSYGDAVNFYRSALKQRGEVLFESPPTHQFEVARFRDDEMAFPPSVTVKDYTWGGSAGYVNPQGGQPERFPTVIQIVPLPTGAK